jgi:hypothetical protein
MTKETMPTQMQVGNSLFLTLENVQKKLSESKSEIKTMIIGYESPIRNMTKDDILSSLSIALPICAELYCGIRKSEFNETVMVEAIQFIYNYYGELGAVEIKQAEPPIETAIEPKPTAKNQKKSIIDHLQNHMGLSHVVSWSATNHFRSL